MQPLDPDALFILREWIEKADADLRVAEQMAVEAPKTHDIQVLLELVQCIDPVVAEAMREADWLSPFGVKVRYPGDAPEMLAGDEQKALDLARCVKRVVGLNLGVSFGP